MGVLTEAALRVLLKDEDLEALEEYRVGADMIVTPSAKSYLIDHRIDLIVGDKRIIKTPGHENKDKADKADKPSALKAPPRESADGGGSSGGSSKYRSIYGGVFDEKPEHMTALRGSDLVFKDHKIIHLRGKADSFEASALAAQLKFHKNGQAKLSDDLGEVIAFTRVLMRCEVLGEPVPEMRLFGMDEAEIRSRSHTPRKYYQVEHFMPITIDDGESAITLNTLRTMVREVELCAYEAFRNSLGVPEREDIVLAYNRLSSAIYVMMLRVRAKEYEA